MLQTVLHVNLPSDELRADRDLWDWVIGLFGREAADGTGRERMLPDGFAVCKQLVASFRHAEITDVLSVCIDGKSVFVDERERTHDLDRAARRALDAGLLGTGFESLDMALSHREHGLHSLFDVRLRPTVLLGEDELRIHVDGRLEGLGPHAGECARDYADRLRETMRDEEFLRAHLGRFDARIESLAKSLHSSLPAGRISHEASRAVLIQPRMEDYGRLRSTPWGDSIRPPRYRARPQFERAGAADRPFTKYYYDPYGAFRHHVLIEALKEGVGWKDARVVVLAADGTKIGDGETAAWRASASAEDGEATAPMRIGEDGSIEIAEFVPEVNAVDVAELGDPGATAGYGGDLGEAGGDPELMARPGDTRQPACVRLTE